MAELNVAKRTTIQAIEMKEEKQTLRPYLGMSQLGHTCDRYLWYSFRWCYADSISARILRLFDRGNREEPAIIATLEGVGVKVHSEQKEVVTGWGHVKGHIDGIAEGVVEAPRTPHLAEFKTMNERNFKLMVKKGVQESKLQYYIQAQLYMHFLDLTRTLFVAVNKNDDSMYIERLYYDKKVSEYAMERAQKIILSEEPPEKIYSMAWWECKFCSAKGICHMHEPVEENCRTCKHCDIVQEGQWLCSDDDTQVVTLAQREGCGDYTKLPCLETA